MRWTLLLFGFIVTLLAVRNVPWHLDDKDQAKQAYTSFEMVEEGNWWFQHTPTGKVATKPPLAGWISAGLHWVTGWEVAWRLPGFACALITLALLWRVGNDLGSAPWGGLIAAGAFGLNHFSQRLATLVRTDMLLAFFIFLAGYLVYERLRAGQPWTSADRWKLFAVVLASMLTKGPIAYAFLLPGLVAFWWIARRRRIFPQVWADWWPWFAPLLVFGAWAGIGIWMSPEFLDQVVRKEFLGRFTVGETAVHHNQPVYFYVGHLLGKFAPWSLLVGALCFHRSVRTSLLTDPARLWLICWVIGGLVFMSLVPSKRADRIYPIIPPLCLLTAALLAPLANERVWKVKGWQLAFGALVAASLITGGSAAFSLAKDLREKSDRLAQFGAEARRLAGPRRDRLIVMNSNDEGLLLYARKPHFTEPGDALGAWREGRVDWVVMNGRDFRKHGAEFQPARRVLEVAKTRETFSEYVLLAREPAGSTSTDPPTQ